jgi:hypothetical protein
MKSKAYILLHFFLVIASFTMWSQHQIKSSVVANGGSTLASESNQITGTIGQSLIGKMINPSNAVKSGFWEQVTGLITNVEIIDNKVLVKEFSLYQNYPNPFNPSTTIQFAIPEESFIKLEIFNAIGEKISTLISETLLAGAYRYEWYADGLPSGIYFYRLSTNKNVLTKKLLFLK